MRVLVLMLEDGKPLAFNPHASVDLVLRALQGNTVSHVVAGETVPDGNGGTKVVWEKQFAEVTVMPSCFGEFDIR